MSRTCSRIASYLVLLVVLCVPEAGAQRISTTLVGFEDGLNQSTVTAIAEGPEGFLWIGTPDGLHRYDGYEFRVYHEDDAGLIDDDIAALVSSPDGEFWVATRHAGLFAYTPRTRRFARVLSVEDLDYARITALALDPVGTLWIGTDSLGVVRFDPETRETQRWPHDPLAARSLSSPHITAIATDRWGNVLVGTRDRGLNVISAATGAVRVFRSLVGISDSLPSDRITSLRVTRDNRLLLGTATGAAGRFDTDTGRFAALGQADPAMGDAGRVTALLESRGGDVWVATSSSVFRLRDGAPPVVVERARRVGVVYEDAAGLIWFGARAGGLSSYAPRSEQFSRYLDGGDSIGALVWSFAETSDGRVWVGTDDGLFGLDPTDAAAGLERVPVAALDAFPVHDLFSDRTLWLALGPGGAAQIDEDGEILRRVGLPAGASSSVLSVHADETSVYLGTAGDGLHVIGETGTRSRYSTATGQPPGGASVYAIESAAEGRLWLGTNAAEVLRFDPRTRTIERWPLPDANSPGTIVWGIEPTRDGSLWLAARESGAILFHPDEGVKLRLVPRVDLPADMVYDVVVDGIGGVWLTTNRGLFRLDESTGEIQRFTRADGISADEFSSGAAMGASDGSIYAGGVNGFVRFDPRRVRPSLYLPPIVITRISDSSGRGLDRTDATLPRGETGFSLTISSLDFADPAANCYSYRLVAHDDEWRSPGADRTIRYSGLPQGDYRLYLRGSNSDGIWNYEGTALDITILPRFWQTKLFVVGMMALAIVLVSFGVYRRLVTADDERNELERIVARRTADLEASKRAMERAIAARTRVEETLRDARDELENRVASRTAALVREVQTRDFSSVDMREYFDSLVSSLASLHGSSFSVETRVDAAPLDITRATPCGLIANELVTNAMKYAFVGLAPSDPRIIRIEFVDEAGAHRLTVADNGAGLRDHSDSPNPTSLGLRIVEVLAEQLDGALTVTSGEQTGFGRGAEFTVRF